MADALSWLENTSLATWIRVSPSIWGYATFLTLHTVGLGIVVGGSAVIDLRLLGFAPRIALASLAPLFRTIWVAFAVNALTGVALFMSDATTKAYRTVFHVKLACIALAIWNTVIIARLVQGAGPEPLELSTRHRRLAIASLLLWAAALTSGRLMAYL